MGLLGASLSALGSAGPLLGLNWLGWIGHLELGTFQSRLAGVPVPANPEIVLVAIEEDTPGRLGLSGPLPLPRHYHAALIEQLRDAGARALVLDLLFVSARETGEDAALCAALADSAPLAVTLVTDYEREANLADPDAPTGWRYRFRRPAVLPQSAPPNVAVASAVAWDPGGMLAGAILLRPDEASGAVIPHAALAAALGRYQIPAAEARWDSENDLVTAGSLAWPVGADGELITRFTPRGQSFDRMEYSEAVAALSSAEGRQAFQGRTVIVGDFSGQDTHLTRHGRMDGPEFLAHTLNTLLLPSPSQVDGWRLPVNFLWSWLLAAGASLAVLSLNWRVAVAGTGGALLLTYLAPFGVLTTTRMWLFTVTPMLATTLAVLVSAIAVVSFASTVLPQHIRSARPKSLTEEATVMFVDLRNSTPIVERLGAVRASELQGELLQVLSRLVQRAGGEVERTLGDGLIALFRRDKREHHAVRALQAARSALEEAAQLGKRWEAEHGVPLSLTIGIESGMVTGTVLRTGATEEWSSSGLTVNQAARLQAACSQEGVDLLLGPAAWAVVREVSRTRYVGTLSLKGIDGPVTAYTIDECFSGTVLAGGSGA